MAVNPLVWPDKDPNETLDYSVDWTARLEPGETIASVEWILPAGLTNAQQANTNTLATVWLSGGVNGILYDVVCRVTTNSVPARIKEKTVVLHVRDK